ncbi:MAG: radical SAM protein [Ruminococcus sp.]|nr:radical SAM protein [Ruminococcus sp.]MBQ6153465.1 radical SAM protein [Ruminococcus sp.]
MKHANVALFIPHNGCPHQCSFCNQKSIAGVAVQPTPDDVRQTVETAIDSLKENTNNAEIAFFGGSFTAIDRDYMLSLLEAAYPYTERFRGVRISTRPDYIDDDILVLLKKYNVSAIELGAQSMSDEVLSANDRGHTANDVRTASRLIREYGIELGLQMMTGLYKSTDELDRYTAQEFVRLSPDTVRIYPTIVMKHTRLAELYQSGVYIPQSLDEAVSLCADLLDLFEGNGVNVIRVGLHHTDSLDTDMLAGPYHPAFRELCESERIYNILLKKYKSENTSDLTVAVSPRAVSKLVGNQKENIQRLQEKGLHIRIIQDTSLDESQMKFIDER